MMASKEDKSEWTCLFSKGGRLLIATDYGKTNDYEIVDIRDEPNSGRTILVVRRVEDLP